MITFLHGKLIEALPTQVVVDVNGVGYEALIPLSSFNKLVSIGSVLIRLPVAAAIARSMGGAVTTTNSHGWMLTAVAARRPQSTISSITSRDTGSPV